MKKFNWTVKVLVIAALVTSCAQTGKKEEDADNKEVKQPKIVSKEVTYELDSVKMTGYLAYDENATEKRPGILVVHEWWGHNEYVRRRARMIAELGYVALAIDMYGDGKVAQHPQDAQKFMREVMSSMDVAKGRFEKGLDQLRNHDKVSSDKIGAVGYCMGGSIVLTMANAGYDLDAVAAFHAGVGLGVWPEPGMKTKVLVCNGAADTFIPERAIVNFKNKMDSAQADYRYISYEGAMHGFTSKEADENGKKFGIGLAYHPEADSASWEEMKRLFEGVF